MIMGFGCSIPAITNTRTLIDERERLLTLRVIPFFSCGAKLPILSAIAGAVSMLAGFNAGLISFAMYIVGMIVAVVTILLMRSTTQRGEISPFIMELPTYHLPRAKNLMLLLWDKVKHYMEKAFTVILASTIVVWFLSNFGWDWKMCEIEDSILASLGQFIQPLFTPLGFGSQLNSFGWVFVVAAFTGLIAKEEVIATFGALGALFIGTMPEGAILVEGVSDVMLMVNNTGITWQALISFIIFNMTTIPCFAAVATAKGEHQKGKFKWTLLFWVATSYIVSSIAYVVLTWWWTSFIVVAVFVIVMFLIKYFNKMRDKRKVG
jgi:ferrous iron transport protein B